jgi:hypothetical protein
LLEVLKTCVDLVTQTRFELVTEFSTPCHAITPLLLCGSQNWCRDETLRKDLAETNSGSDHFIDLPLFEFIGPLVDRLPRNAKGARERSLALEDVCGLLFSHGHTHSTGFQTV